MLNDLCSDQAFEMNPHVHEQNESKKFKKKTAHE